MRTCITVAAMPCQGVRLRRQCRLVQSPFSVPDIQSARLLPARLIVSIPNYRIDLFAANVVPCGSVIHNFSAWVTNRTHPNSLDDPSNLSISENNHHAGLPIQATNRYLRDTKGAAPK
jgi:hypothetical protein